MQISFREPSEKDDSLSHSRFKIVEVDPFEEEAERQLDEHAKHHSNAVAVYGICNRCFPKTRSESCSIVLTLTRNSMA